MSTRPPTFLRFLAAMGFVAFVVGALGPWVIGPQLGPWWTPFALGLGVPAVMAVFALILVGRSVFDE